MLVENKYLFDKLVCPEGEDEDHNWNLSENPTNPIGQSNGDHDLARTVLEVVLVVDSLIHCFKVFLLIILL